MADAAVIEGVRTYLRALQETGMAVTFGVIFGSQQTGGATPDSDIDLLVVSPRFDGRRDRDDVRLLWRMAARTDSRIEPVPCGERQWVEDDASAIIEVARRGGEKVSPT